jgi:hypothetical protein
MLGPLSCSELGSGPAIQHFSARGGELDNLVSLVHLVCLVFLVYVVRRTRETIQPRRSPLALAISYKPYAIRSSLYPLPSHKTPVHSR